MADTFSTKRSFLALAWSIVNLLTLGAFVVAFIVAISTRNYNPYNNNYNRNYNNNRNGNYYYGYGYNNQQNQNNQRDDEDEVLISVTSRAMAFAVLWTAVLAILIGVYGTVVLGFVNFGGKYYWCCSRSVHSTTPMVLGSFMGALLMFANLTLVCAVLFGEFNIRDSRNGEGASGDGGREANWARVAAYERSSLAFSTMCTFLTGLYALFSILVFTYSDDLLQENQEDLREEVRKRDGDGWVLGLCSLFLFACD
jgi:hypothetical protein